MQNYLSHHFRNKKRYSNEIKKESCKIVAKENASIVATSVNQRSIYDKVGYDRDMESLKAELSKDPNDQCDSTITNVLNLTHEQRHLQINDCLVRITSILDDFPFFRELKWVWYIILYYYSIFLSVSYLFYYEQSKMTAQLKFVFDLLDHDVLYFK